MGRRAILFLWAAFPCLLRSELLAVRSYSTADGLASDHVTCIVSDSRGFLWFCTPEGLSRFDGSRFVNYAMDEGLPHNTVTTVLETRSGEYFVGTARGISRINPSGRPRFTTFAPETKPADNYVSALRESRTGKIWCATLRAIYEWDRASRFRRRELPLAPGEKIGDLMEDAEGKLWVATTAGLFILGDNGPLQSFTPSDGLPGDRVAALLLDSKGRMWAATRGGIAQFERRAGGCWTLARSFTTRTGMAGYVQETLAEAPDGSLWIGSDWGITLLDPAHGEPRVVNHISRDQGLSDRHIDYLAIDRAGNVWAATEGAGVMRLDRHGFTTYREQDGLATDRVLSVFEDRSGNLMAATVTGFLRRSVNIFDRTGFRGVDLPVFDGHASWVPNRILLQSRSGEWWAASSDGLCRFPAGAARSLNGRRPKACYPSGTVFQVFEDSHGGIWASAQSNAGDRLMRWDPRTDSVTDIATPRTAGSAADDIAGAFAEDSQGNIWMGLWKGGVYRYDGRTFRYFAVSDGVPGGTIWALLAEGRSLWIASNGNGLARVPDTAAAQPRFQLYNTSNGLASNIVFCLAADVQGRIYAGTGKGIDRLDPETGQIRHFSAANGLAHGEIRSAFRDRSGALWFGTTQGLSRLDPAADRPAANPRILITDVRAGGAEFPVSQTGESAISNLQLKSSANQLQVEFAGFDGDAGDSLRYAYRLEGADRVWSLPRVQRLVNYAALAAGTYRFLVKAVTPEGAESSVPAEVDFTVLPPLWRRWWFESLALCLAATAIFAAHRYRVAQMVNLERVRTAIATDLHDDIGASLSQIAILSEVALVNGNGRGQAGEPLERVATLARELVDSMSDVVWSIRSEPHGVDSLVRRMREFATDLLVSQGIAFDLHAAGGDANLTLQARRQLFLIYKEAVHNAARHSRCTRVDAELRVQDGEVILGVRDNGTGLDTGGPGNGIPSMRRRAESLGGRVEWVSNNGCSVVVRLPIRHSTFARA